MDVFKMLNQQYQDNLPFVIYQKPNSDTVIAILQNDAESYFWENDGDSGFVFCDFSGEVNLLLPIEKSSIYYQKTNFLAFSGLQSKENLHQNIQDKISFEKLVSDAIFSIQNGAFSKVVVSRKEKVAIEEIDLSLLFGRLISNYSSAFCYCFFHPSSGLWIGATPEQLVKISEEKLQTVSLAGTKIWSETEEIYWSEKEKTEQHLVTQFIESSLQPFVKTISKSAVATIKAGSLAHLKTAFNVLLKENISLKQLVSILHPTPAVCGLPKDAAKRFIFENEKYHREFYTGFLGECNIDFKTMRKEKTDLFVNLRCMKVQEKEAEIFVGCGITAESNAQNEFIETQNKTMTMHNVL